MKKRTTITIAVLAAGAVCLTVGVLLGQYGGVLRKAIIICLECIGIG